ncbi:hypothetical protein C7M84_007721 [Penaeus vannamei]|uniref:Uncharacterized protein n=1 Tax=Penaeus vannamei TaxID=6689 RepID=A0A423TBM1_PENVA|nr:hypothetical protein C7M84_007721 [Penaeus vannamei]
MTPEVTRASTTPEASTSTTPEATASTTPGASTSTTPEETTSVTPEATPSTTPEETTSVTPEASIPTTPEATTVTPEVTTTPTSKTTKTSTAETTTEAIPLEPSTSTTVPEAPAPPPVAEADLSEAILQVSQTNEGVDCDNTSSEIRQSVEIINEVDKDDLLEALHRLAEGEKSHGVIETIFSQNSSSSDNSSWYYMDQNDIVWMDKEEKFQSDIHIGFGLLIVFPLIMLDGQIAFVVFIRTFIDEPANPIVQIYQSFSDRSACGCIEGEESDNTTHEHNAATVIQHFTSNSSYSHREIDIESITDYVEMLFAVPEHQREVVELVIVNEIEGDDCETTTATTASTAESTTPTFESSMSASTTEAISTTEPSQSSTVVSTTEALTTTESTTPTSTSTESTAETMLTTTTPTLVPTSIPTSTESTPVISTTTSTTVVSTTETLTSSEPTTSTLETVSVSTTETTTRSSTTNLPTVFSTTSKAPETSTPTITVSTTEPIQSSTSEATTTEFVTTEPSTSITVADVPEIPPAPDTEEDGSILQISQINEAEDCDNTSSEFIQSVEIDNKIDENEIEETLHRLREAEKGHCVLETISSQNSSTSDNSSWYYVDQHDIVWMAREERFQSDVHIGFGLLVVLPLLALDGEIQYVVLVRTFVDEPASPIVQIYQSFHDRSLCGCIEGEASENATHEHGVLSVIQHFTSKSNDSRVERDTYAVTDYIEMLFAVPEHRRNLTQMTIVKEIEGEDCETTTATTTSIETTTLTSESSTSSSTTEALTTTKPTRSSTEASTLASTTETVTTSELTTLSQEPTSTPTSTVSTIKTTTDSAISTFESISTSTSSESTTEGIRTTIVSTTETLTSIEPTTTTLGTMSVSTTLEATSTPLTTEFSAPPTTLETSTPAASTQPTTGSTSETIKTSTPEAITTEFVTTEPSTSITVTDVPEIPPAPDTEEDGSILQISQINEAEDCDNISSEFIQESFQRDVHIGFGLLVVLPLLALDGEIQYVVLVRTFVDEPASPIVQVYQTFKDRSACGCTEGGEHENKTHDYNVISVIQHFTQHANYSEESIDMDAMTDYIEMLFAVPEQERNITAIAIVKEIEGVDCEENETTTVMSTRNVTRNNGDEFNITYNTLNTLNTKYITGGELYPIGNNDIFNNGKNGVTLYRYDNSDLRINNHK